MNKEELFAELEVFLEQSISSELGYYKIAKSTQNPLIQSLSNLKYTERNTYTLELKKCFLQINAIPVRHLTKNTKAPIKWVDHTTILSLKDLNVIIDEIIKSEQKSLIDYHNLLERDDLPAQLRTILENQKKAILNGIEHLKLRKVA